MKTPLLELVAAVLFVVGILLLAAGIIGKITLHEYRAKNPTKTCDRAPTPTPSSRAVEVRPTALETWQRKRCQQQQAACRDWGNTVRGETEKATLEWVIMPPPPSTGITYVESASSVSSGRWWWEDRPRKRINPEGLSVANEEQVAALLRMPIVDIEGYTTGGDCVVGGIIVPAELEKATTTRGPVWGSYPHGDCPWK